MDDTVVLILLVIVMLVGSYLAGNIPLVVNLSEVIHHFIHNFVKNLSLTFYSHLGQIKNCFDSWCWFVSWNRFDCYHS